jgi:DNA invertase Pin-like site-specific DNA recombinase
LGCRHGAKGRNGRPALDTLCRDATKRQFDVVMAWNVDRLGRTQRIARPFDGAENASIATAG